MRANAENRPPHRDLHREVGIELAHVGVSQGEAGRIDRERQRMEAEEQVFGFALVDRIRDTERQPNPDVRDDPGEHYSGEELRVHRIGERP